MNTSRDSSKNQIYGSFQKGSKGSSIEQLGLKLKGRTAHAEMKQDGAVQRKASPPQPKLVPAVNEEVQFVICFAQEAISTDQTQMPADLCYRSKHVCSQADAWTTYHWGAGQELYRCGWQLPLSGPDQQLLGQLLPPPSGSCPLQPLLQQSASVNFSILAVCCVGT